MKYKYCILEDQKLLRKFCQAMDRHYGCKRAFGVSKDGYGQCISCPLATAEQVMFLMNLKGLNMGEAVKATLRSPVPPAAGPEILSEIVKGRAPYPASGANDERAAGAVILGEAKDEEAD